MGKHIIGTSEEFDSATSGRKIYLMLEPASLQTLIRNPPKMTSFKSAMVHDIPDLVVRSLTREKSSLVVVLGQSSKPIFGDQKPGFFINKVADFAEQRLTELLG